MDEPERQQGGGHTVQLGGWEGGGSIGRGSEAGADLETQQKRGKGIQAEDGWGRN